jgi:nucleoside-diphosphate-sugar epimerase
MLLVTGGTGFIGSHLLERLSMTGEPARALVRRSVPLPAGVEPIIGDLLSGSAVDEALRGVDTVIHLGGVIKSLTRSGYYEGNTRATEMLASAIGGRDIRLVHVSSLAAAGPSEDGAPVHEDAEPHPVSDYGKSKLEAERAVRVLTPHAVIVRPPVVYGPRDTGVLQVLKPITRGWSLEIAGGERWFSAIFVRDLVDGLMAAVREPRAAGRTYFLCHPKPVSWTQLGAAAARMMGRRLRVVHIPARLAYGVGFCGELWARGTRTPGFVSREKISEAVCMNWTCDPRRATEELNFSARTALDDGLAETLAWYKEAGWLKY